MKRTIISLLLPVFIALFCLTACAPRIAGSVPERQTEEKTDLSAPKEPARLDDAGRTGLLERLKNHPDARVAALGEGAFLDWLEERFGPERLIALADRAQSGELSSETFYELMGNTAAVLFDLYYGLPDNVRLCESPRLGACIRVVGDVSFADNWKIIPVLEEKGEGIEGVVSPEALSLLRSSDVTLVNNEFTYSTRGAPLANKAYTFRADPGRVSLFSEQSRLRLRRACLRRYPANAARRGSALYRGRGRPGGGVQTLLFYYQRQEIRVFRRHARGKVYPDPGGDRNLVGRFAYLRPRRVS